MNFVKRNGLHLAWAIAVIAMAGSLYFSEVRDFSPCVLCWYQRIALYPLVALLVVAIMRHDKNVPYYVLPLTIIGGLIAIYHNLLYYEILPESAAPCISGISCTTQYIQWFGFITIPLLSLGTFVIITTLMVLYLRYRNT